MRGLDIPGVLVDELSVFQDERGAFQEVMRSAAFPSRFVQSNHSQSRKNVLRGLHYHRHQADLWYVVRGRMQVGLVDLRQGEESSNPSTLILDEEKRRTLYIPPGVAHGFLALSDVDLIYWVTREYDASDEHGVAWDDPALALGWITDSPILSNRDVENPPLRWQDLPEFS